MYYTLSIDEQGDQHLWDHKNREEAEHFAAEVAAEGLTCHILEVVSTRPGLAQPSLEELYGVRPGIDFPATL